MTNPTEQDIELVHASSVYHDFLEERDEILRHKWIESQKAGYDVGFEHALVDWIVKHRSSWRAGRQKTLGSEDHC